MNAAIYTRVSTDMQIDGYSLNAQLDACKALANGRGWQVVHVYTDEGKSAKTAANRPQLQALLQDARAYCFDVVIFHKLDRFSRSVKDTLNILSELENLGIEIETVIESIDRSTPAGKLTFTMQASIAQWYSENLSIETKKGKRARAAAGMWSGGDVPFGYQVDYKKDGGDGIARPHPIEAEAVKLAFEKYATGNYSNYDIASLLNEAGHRPRGRGKRALKLFSKDTVASMLQNRFYTGKTSYKGEYFTGLHEPIISEELFNRAQAARHDRRSKPNTKTRKNGRVYVLSGMAYCARCKTKMRGYVCQGYQYYRDPARDLMVDCDQKLVRADRVETALGKYLTGLELPQDWRNKVLRLLQVETGRAGEIRKERGAIERQLERLKNLYFFGDISKGEYLNQRRQLQARRDSLNPPTLPDIEKAAALLGDFGAIWKAATQEERKQIAQTLLQSVYLDSDKTTGPIIAVEPKPELAQLFAIFMPTEPGKPVAPAERIMILPIGVNPCLTPTGWGYSLFAGNHTISAEPILCE